MAKFEGFLGQAPDGRARLFLRASEDEYVDYDPAVVLAAVCVEGSREPLAVFEVELPDDAAIERGRISESDLDDLFRMTDTTGGMSARAAILADAGHVGTFLVCAPDDEAELARPDFHETRYEYCYTRLYCIVGEGGNG